VSETTEKKYAHDVVSHPVEGETRPIDVTVRYHYAQAIAWHYAFAARIGEAWTAESDFALSQYLGHSHLAFLYDALSQGRGGQETADWVSHRTGSSSPEFVWERAISHGIDPDAIRPYKTKRRAS
jgi:hypothetical protein